MHMHKITSHSLYTFDIGVIRSIAIHWPVLHVQGSAGTKYSRQEIQWRCPANAVARMLYQRTPD